MPIPRKRTDNYIATEVDGEIVLIDLDGGELFSLKGTGRAVWELIDGKRDRSRIMAALAETYDARQSELESDLGDLLADLSDAGLVEV